MLELMGQSEQKKENPMAPGPYRGHQHGLEDVSGLTRQKDHNQAKIMYKFTEEMLSISI